MALEGAPRCGERGGWLSGAVGLLPFPTLILQLFSFWNPSHFATLLILESLSRERTWTEQGTAPGKAQKSAEFASGECEQFL